MKIDVEFLENKDEFSGELERETGQDAESAQPFTNVEPVKNNEEEKP